MMDIIDTSFLTEFELIDITAAGDTTYSTKSNQSFGTVKTLSTGTEYISDMTFEHNFSVLDGSMGEFSESPIISFFSNSASKADGTFDTNPTITIDFTVVHNTVGFTLYFADDFPLECRVKWYDETGSTIDAHTFEITDIAARLWRPVQRFYKVVIEFTRALPFHYVKLNKIVYGQVVEFDETRVTTASLVEELDPISNQLSINKLKFTVTDLDDELNFGNDGGLHAYIQHLQVLRPHEYIRGEKYYLGKYFIDTFSNTQWSSTFNCVDYVGLLDDATFYKGKMYDGVRAGDIIDAIMAEVPTVQYTVDEEVAETLLYGTIKPMTCRKALREVAFACCALVDSSRSDTLNIFKADKHIKNTLGQDVKISTKTTKREYVSGVDVKFTQYTEKETDKASKVVSGVYPAGDNVIKFSSPQVSVESTAGTITESGTYYCILHLDTESEVTINGYGYSNETVTASARTNELEWGEQENIKSYTSTLTNAELAMNVAKYILADFNHRLEISTQYIADKQTIKEWNIVKNPNTLYNDYVAGFTSISTDLTNGFIATAKLVGYYNHANDYYFTGEELYTPDYDTALL